MPRPVGSEGLRPAAWQATAQQCPRPAETHVIVASGHPGLVLSARRLLVPGAQIQGRRLRALVMRLHDLRALIVRLHRLGPLTLLLFLHSTSGADQCVASTLRLEDTRCQHCGVAFHYKTLLKQLNADDRVAGRRTVGRTGLGSWCGRMMGGRWSCWARTCRACADHDA